MRQSRRVGQYHVLDRVASGGMADVYRAKVVNPDGGETLYALKQVLEQYAEDPSFVRMLVAEYKLSLLLVHPNIATIHELLRTPDGYFIVMEYVDGKDLRAVIHRGNEVRQPMDTADAVYLMARAVDGLFHAHTAATPDGRPLQLVHRDFSPSNILVGYDGSVKIIDFGIAKANVDRERTAAGIIKGKVKYMSPEQAQGDDKLTGQSDVFSAGSVLYELLTGTPAFTAPSEVELIYTVRRAAPFPLRQVAPHIPDSLVALVERAMARQRKDRFPDAASFRDALVTFLRAYSPGYRRTRLANYMRELWTMEIEEELRTLLEYAMSEAPAGESVNLLEKASLEQSMRDVTGAFDDIPTPAVDVENAGVAPEAAPPSDDLFAAELGGATGGRR